MGCYIVVFLAGLAHMGIALGTHSLQDDRRHRWLAMLFAGGTVFGFVDHLVNGELFFGGNLVEDLTLGVLITFAILATWGVMVAVDAYAQRKPQAA